MAHWRNDHNKKFNILENLRRAEKDWKRTLSNNHKKIMEYWQKKADNFIEGIQDEPETYISTTFCIFNGQEKPDMDN